MTTSMRPECLEIKLVRHGESQANTGEVATWEVGDHRVALTKLGEQQAREAGAVIGADFLREALIFYSPYLRTRQTLENLLVGAGIEPGTLKTFEDPRLREVEFGYEDDPRQTEQRATHGYFYYRFKHGESPADCFDRTSSFLEGMMRQVLRHQARKVLVVSHGLTIRCFVMRFLHLTVDQFLEIANPGNADVITIASKACLSDAMFVTQRYAVNGLKRFQG